MGPDGQQMEYNNHATRPPNAAPAEYTPQPNQQPYANQRPPHFPPDGPPFDPSLVQDPYGYTRGVLPPDPAGKFPSSTAFFIIIINWLTVKKSCNKVNLRKLLTNVEISLQ
jgi:hypothetical protein